MADPVTIDEDLGRSGGGRERPGYERLVAAVCRGDIGIVVPVEASRLARNGRDWHRLLELCGLVGTLIADEETVYDPRLIDDRLLLGMKGVLSEMELSAFHQRSQAALKKKPSAANSTRALRLDTCGLRATGWKCNWGICPGTA